VKERKRSMKEENTETKKATNQKIWQNQAIAKYKNQEKGKINW